MKTLTNLRYYLPDLNTISRGVAIVLCIYGMLSHQDILMVFGFLIMIMVMLDELHADVRKLRAELRNRNKVTHTISKGNISFSNDDNNNKTNPIGFVATYR